VKTYQLRFTTQKPVYTYIIHFGSPMNPLQMPKNLMIRQESNRPIKEGDFIKCHFEATQEVLAKAEDFANLHPEIFRAKRFKVVGRMGEHIVFLSPC
jgi:hypothetical protein